MFPFLPTTKLTNPKLLEVFLLYGIPVLDVTLFYFDFPKAQDDVHLQDLIVIGQDIDRITSGFLFTQLETSLVRYAQTEKLHSVELDVFVRLASSLNEKDDVSSTLIIPPNDDNNNNNDKN